MTLRKQTRTAQSRTLLTTDTDRVAGNSYTFHKYADKAKPKEWFRCSTSQQPQKEQASAEKENIVNVRTVCTPIIPSVSAENTNKRSLMRNNQRYTISVMCTFFSIYMQHTSGEQILFKHCSYHTANQLH